MRKTLRVSLMLVVMGYRVGEGMLRNGRMTRAEANMCIGKHDKDMSRTTKEIHGERSMSCVGLVRFRDVLGFAGFAGQRNR